MSMKEFVKKSERQSRESIDHSYREIDNLYWDINFLNDMLHRYMNRNSGRTLTHNEKQKVMEEIRLQISNVYKYINYHKECINVEKKEMKRIHTAYGYSYDVKPDYRSERDSEYDNSGDEYVPPYTEEEEELEEIKEYKYNYATGLFE